ncbi:MAG: hypothetical protein LC122_14170 [Chitinophagales bacterium]|nr:hypothetical protein [Chitinophagales bacterium]
MNYVRLNKLHLVAYGEHPIDIEFVYGCLKLTVTLNKYSISKIISSYEEQINFYSSMYGKIYYDTFKFDINTNNGVIEFLFNQEETENFIMFLKNLVNQNDYLR